MNYEYEHAIWWLAAALLALTMTHAVLLLWVCRLKRLLRILRHDFYLLRDAWLHQHKADAIRDAREKNDESKRDV